MAVLLKTKLQPVLPLQLRAASTVFFMRGCCLVDIVGFMLFTVSCKARM